MKVKELLEILQQANPEGQLWMDISTSDDTRHEPLDIISVERVPDKNYYYNKPSPQQNDVIILINHSCFQD